MSALGSLMESILDPGNIAVLSFVGGLGVKAYRAITKKLDSQQQEVIDKIDSRVDALESFSTMSNAKLEKEILRLQILDGIDANRLSISETLYFFDKYKALGGNSFVEDRVQEYIRKLSEAEGRI